MSALIGRKTWQTGSSTERPNYIIWTVRDRDKVSTEHQQELTCSPLTYTHIS